MPSGNDPSQAARRFWRFLAANDTGIVLLLAIGLLFAAGSLVREFLPDAYGGLRGDDLRFFLRGFRIVDLWFWALVGACVLLGLSLAACAIEALLRRIRLQARDPRDFGPVLAHAGAGLALLAHAIGGWGGSETFAAAGERPAPLGRYEVRLLDVSSKENPDGTLRRQEARIGIRDSRGFARTERIGPNAPATWDSGRDLLLLMRVQEEASSCILEIDGRADTLAPGDARPLADGGRLVLERLFAPPEYRVAVARVRIAGGPREGVHLLGSGIPSGLEGLALREARTRPVAILSYRRAPGTPLLLVGALVFAAGTLLSGARWIRRSAPARAVPPIGLGGGAGS